MRVILKKDVSEVGLQGEIVRVAKGFYRNYLLPRDLAVEAGKANIKWLESQQRKARTRQAEEKEKELQSNAKNAEIQQKILFYQAVQIAMQGIINYSDRLSKRAAELAVEETDPNCKRNLLTMSKVCARVPAEPASTIREAVNSLWLCQIGIHAENINMAISPGRLDQVLYPWYRADIDAGRLTVSEAVELVGCLWLKLNDNTNLVPETAEQLFGGAGTVPAAAKTRSAGKG